MPEQIAVNLCTPIEERVEGLLDPDAFVGHCGTCDRRIWISRKTLARIVKELGGAEIRCLCNDCGLDTLDLVDAVGDEREWRLTPEQEWFRSELP